MIISNLPFHIGPTAQPLNPSPLPDSLDFVFCFDPEAGALRQTPSLELDQILQCAYKLGTAFGTPLADDAYGKPYADDFLDFIDGFARPPGRACEIGAGVGYLSRRLIDRGWTVASLEPGQGYAPYWERYGVAIIQDFFPSPRALGPFNMICAYGVLEHIADLARFLGHVREHLVPGGVAIFSVPDCTEELTAGDPAILLHEHYTYFNAETLAAMLWQAGFDAVVRPSGYSRCLYAAARYRATGAKPAPPRNDLALLASYPVRAASFITFVHTRLAEIAQVGTLGLYCPGRALAVLDRATPMRFFDDDPAQRGKYLPPFAAPIEGWEALLAFPVDTVVVMSRTFGERIRINLRQRGYDGKVLTVSELFV